jgi:hypothetical protein
MINKDDFTRVNNDSNGNPRFVCHFLAFTKPEDSKPWEISEKYVIALARAKPLGGKKFHNKQYGGGIVFQSYNLDALCDEINQTMGAL